MNHTWLLEPQASPGGIILLRLHPGDEIHACLRDVARRERLPGASITGLGAVNDIVLAWFDPGQRRYTETRLQENLEVVSLTGNLAWVGEDPVAHLHGVVSRVDCSTLAGHVMRGLVSVTVELTLHVGSRRIRREHDPAFDLNLLAFD